MGALPIPIEAKRELPDYLPARMVNEFAYCPRLFFYEWVEGVFAGERRHDGGRHPASSASTRKRTALPAADEICRR